MKFNKSSVLFGASLICFGVFIISFLKLILGDASDASENYGFSYSIIAGIVIAIPTIIEIFKCYKTAGNKNLISFTVGCFKKENGKELHQLALALLFSIFPVVILIGVLFLGSDSSNTSGSSKNSGQTNRVATSSNNGSNSNTKNNRQTQSSDSSESNREINRIAGSSANEIKTVTDGVHNEIQKIYKDNPGLSDEEVLEMMRKHNPNMNIETVRAHKPSLNMTHQEINKIAGSSDNNIKTITEGVHNEIQKVYKNNPGLSDEEVLKMMRKRNHNMNIETVRAHKPM